MGGALLVASTGYTFTKEKREAKLCHHALLLGHEGCMGPEATMRQMERTKVWTWPKWVKGIVKRFSNLW
jgi:hypothetical protein